MSARSQVEQQVSSITSAEGDDVRTLPKNIDQRVNGEESNRDSEPLLGSQPSARTSESAESQSKDEACSSVPDQGTFDLEMGVDEASVMRRVNFHILPIFFALAMLCSIDRANLSFAATQLNHDLNFSKSVYGYGSGIFFIGYAVMALPTPFICDKIGAPVFLGTVLIIWGLTATLFAFMTNGLQFMILRFLLGISESGAYPGMWYHLALFYTDKELGLAYTIVSTASSLSGAAGGPLASVLLKLDGFLGFRGWQWLFLLEGIPPLILGSVMIFFLARTPETARFLLPHERRWLVTRKQGSGNVKDSLKDGLQVEKQERPSAWTSLVTMLKSWRVWWLSAIWMIVVLGVDCMVFWIPLMLRSVLYDEEAVAELSEADEDAAVKSQGVHVALLSCIPFASAAIGMLIVANVSKKTGERHWCIILPLAFAAILLFILPSLEGRIPWLAVSILSLACAGVWGPHGPLLSWPAKILDGTAAAAGFALIKMVGSFSSFAGNAAVGKLYDVTGGFAAPTYMLAGVMALGIILTATFKDQDGNRAMGFGQLIDNVKRLKRSRSDPVEYSLDRNTNRGTQWKRIGGDPANAPFTHFEMPEMPAFGSEDLVDHAYLRR